MRTVTRPERSLIVKTARPGATAARRAALRQRAETEHLVLTRIAPRIAPGRSAVRCPEVLGYDPGPPSLFLELVDGRSLQSLVFGARGRAHRAGVARALGLAAEWLAGLHTATRSDDERNVFDWIGADLDFPPTRRIVTAYAGPDVHAELRELAARFRLAYPDARQPVCRIHGFFHPRHVLVHARGICVIDLEASRPGFAGEDLALFTGCYELAAPWRRLVAQRSMPLEEQIALLWDTYATHVGPATGPERIAQRFSRLIGMARFVALCVYGRQAEDVLAAAGAFADPASAPPVPPPPSRAPLRSRLLEPWWRYRLRAAIGQELSALRAA